MDIKEALNRIVGQLDLTTEEMQAVMRQIMTGQCTDAQVGAFLMGMRMKSETIDEIVGAVQVMRELAAPVRFDTDKLVDTCGTGGDGMNIFNVSTAASFVVAAAGGKVAKHGNRAVSGKSGSADLLEAGSSRPDARAGGAQCRYRRCRFHVRTGPSWRHEVRGRASPRTRVAYPVQHPRADGEPGGCPASGARRVQQALCRPMAEVLSRLGSKHVLVVHAQDGLDEISLAAPTHVAELKDGEIREYSIQPEDFGIKSQSLIGLNVEDAQGSLALIRDALGRRKSENGQKAADMIVLNAGAALYAADVATTLKQGGNGP